MNRNILLENLGLKDINPLQCGEVYGRIPSKKTALNKELYLLVYILSGNCSLTSPLGQKNVNSGQIVFIRPEENIMYYSKSDTPLHYIWVGFECHFNLDSLQNSDVTNAPDAKHIFLDIAGSDNIRHGRELYICGKIYQLLSLLQYRDAPDENFAQRYVRMALNYIETNYNGPLRVDAIAAQLNIDRAYFSKIFSKEVGESPQEYIVNYRLSKAAELLSLQGLSASEAAQKVGYRDLCHFSRIFKQRYGVPPSMYREFKANEQEQAT